MSEILSRWPVLITVALDGADRDATQRLTADAVDRLLGTARAAYFEQCTTVGPHDIDGVATTQFAIGDPVTCGHVTVSLGVIEIYPDGFTMEARIRPRDDPGLGARARCRVRLHGPVTDPIRDELIALAHAARHMH